MVGLAEKEEAVEWQKRRQSDKRGGGRSRKKVGGRLYTCKKGEVVGYTYEIGRLSARFVVHMYTAIIYILYTYLDLPVWNNEHVAKH